MSFQDLMDLFIQEEGVEQSTMMKFPCLRFKGDFMAMFFEKEESLIVKVAPDRVNHLIDEGIGNPFNLTGKKFKEWVLIPLDYEEEYEGLVREALEYAMSKK